MKPEQEPHDPPTREFRADPMRVWSRPNAPHDLDLAIYTDHERGINVFKKITAAEARSFAAALLAAADRAEGKS